MAVEGAFEAWPRHRMLPRAGRIAVAFGEPLAPPGRGRAACEAAAREVQGRVAALREELRQRNN